ncbi:hypothetical protein B5S32_g1044 [[Candida] boidinii]|nr:hypothetical protein B5S29_g1429 [[Candida] boidinii]OWB76887.1 hypothetical protein B5S32_g1044 [[Candida] boidinii]
MQAAMSATGSRRPGDLVNGIPSTALSRSLNDIGNIDVSYETPVSKKQNQNQQHQGYYGGPQQQPPQQQQRQQFYGGHPSNGVPPPNGFYQQQYQGSQEFHNNMYQQHHLQPQQHRNGSSNNISHSRRSSITSNSSTTFNKFLKKGMKFGRSSGGNNSSTVAIDKDDFDDGDGDGDGDGKGTVDFGKEVSFDDIKHIRDRGRYGANNIMALDSTPYIPTILTKTDGAASGLTNTQYRKMLTAQKKQKANAIASQNRSDIDTRAQSLQTNFNPMMMMPQNGGYPRTMSLNSAPMNGGYYQQKGQPQPQPQQQPYMMKGGPGMNPQMNDPFMNGRMAPMRQSAPMVAQQFQQQRQNDPRTMSLQNRPQFQYGPKNGSTTSFGPIPNGVNNGSGYVDQRQFPNDHPGMQPPRAMSLTTRPGMNQMNGGHQYQRMMGGPQSQPQQQPQQKNPRANSLSQLPMVLPLPDNRKRELSPPQSQPQQQTERVSLDPSARLKDTNTQNSSMSDGSDTESKPFKPLSTDPSRSNTKKLNKYDFSSGFDTESEGQSTSNSSEIKSSKLDSLATKSSSTLSDDSSNTNATTMKSIQSQLLSDRKSSPLASKDTIENKNQTTISPTPDSGRFTNSNVKQQERHSILSITSSADHEINRSQKANNSKLYQLADNRTNEQDVFVTAPEFISSPSKPITTVAESNNSNSLSDFAQPNVNYYNSNGNDTDNSSFSSYNSITKSPVNSDDENDNATVTHSSEKLSKKINDINSNTISEKNKNNNNNRTSPSEDTNSHMHKESHYSIDTHSRHSVSDMGSSTRVVSETASQKLSRKPPPVSSNTSGSVTVPIIPNPSPRKSSNSSTFSGLKDSFKSTSSDIKQKTSSIGNTTSNTSSATSTAARLTKPKNFLKKLGFKQKDKKENSTNNNSSNGSMITEDTFNSLYNSDALKSDPIYPTNNMDYTQNKQILPNGRSNAPPPLNLANKKDLPALPIKSPTSDSLMNYRLTVDFKDTLDSGLDLSMFENSPTDEMDTAYSANRPQNNNNKEFDSRNSTPLARQTPQFSETNATPKAAPPPTPTLAPPVLPPREIRYNNPMNDVDSETESEIITNEQSKNSISNETLKPKEKEVKDDVELDSVEITPINNDNLITQAKTDEDKEPLLDESLVEQKPVDIPQAEHKLNHLDEAIAYEINHITDDTYSKTQKNVQALTPTLDNNNSTFDFVGSTPSSKHSSNFDAMSDLRKASDFRDSKTTALDSLPETGDSHPYTSSIKIIEQIEKSQADGKEIDNVIQPVENEMQKGLDNEVLKRNEIENYTISPPSEQERSNSTKKIVASDQDIAYKKISGRPFDHYEKPTFKVPSVPSPKEPSVSETSSTVSTPTIGATQRDNSTETVDGSKIAFTVEQMGIISANSRLLHELQVVTNELADSISRELVLEDKLYSRDTYSEKVSIKSFENINTDSRSQAKEISDLTKELVEERKKRYAAEELCVLANAGESLNSSYKNSELATRIDQLSNELSLTHSKMEILQQDNEDISEQLEKVKQENKVLVNKTIPNLKNTVEMLENRADNSSNENINSSIQQENNKLREKLSVLDKYSSIENQRDALKEELRALKNKNEMDHKIQQNKIHSLEQTITTLKNWNEELSKKLNPDGYSYSSDSQTRN